MFLLLKGSWGVPPEEEEGALLSSSARAWARERGAVEVVARGVAASAVL